MNKTLSQILIEEMKLLKEMAKVDQENGQRCNSTLMRVRAHGQITAFNMVIDILRDKAAKEKEIMNDYALTAYQNISELMKVEFNKISENGLNFDREFDKYFNNINPDEKDN